MGNKNIIDLIRRAIAIPVIALAILAAAFLAQVLSMKSSMQWVDRTDQVISSDRELLNLAIDMETGLRGYLNTGSEVSLQPYDEANRFIDSKFDQLHQLVSDNPARQENLAGIRGEFNQWRSYAQSTIELRRNGKAGPDYESDLKGKRLMDSIRASHFAFVETEEQQRDDRVRSAETKTRWVIITTVLLALGIGAFLAVFTRRRMMLIAARFQGLLNRAEKHAEESKEAAQALGAAEEEFRSLANFIPQLCWMANPDGWLFWYNQRWYEYTGTTPEQMEGWGWQSVHDAEALPGVMERWKVSIATGEPFDMVFPLRGADGIFRPFLTRVLPVKDAQGKIARWFGTNTEIGEQKRIEAELRRHQQWLSVTLASIGDGVLATDSEGRITFLNPVAAALTGWNPEEAEGRPVQEIFRIINEKTGAAAEDIVARVLREERGTELANHTAAVAKNGAVIPIEDSAAPIRDSAGEVIGVVVVFHDVTEKRTAIEKLRESEAQLRLALNANQAGMWTVDLPSGCRTLSPELQQLYGIEPEESDCTQEGAMRPVIPEDRERLAAAMDSAMRSGKIEHDFRYTRAGSDDIRWMQARGRVIRDAQGQPARLIGVNTDITERKQIEESLREQAALLDLTHDTIIVWDLDGAIRFWNHGAEEKYGYTKEQAIGRVSRDLLCTVFPQPPEEIEATLLREGRWDGELLHTSLNGEITVDSSRWALLRNENGQPFRIMEINRDITRRKQSQEELQAQRRLLETVINHLPCSVALIRGRDLTFQLVNPAYQAIAPGKEMVGKSVWEVWPETDPVLIERHRQVLETGTPFEVTDECHMMSRFAGGPLEPAYFSYSEHRVALPGEDGYGLLLTIWETTERVRVEQNIRESEAKYRGLFNSIQEMVTVYEVDRDSNGRIVERRFLDGNSAFLRALGVSSADQIRGKRSIEVFGEAWFSSHSDAVQRAMDSGETVTQEVHHQETGRDYITTIVPLDENTYLGTGRDITVRKRAEEDARRARLEWERTFDSVPDLIAILDNRRRIVRVNLAMAKRMGAKPEDCVGVSCFASVHGASAPHELCPHSLTLQDCRQHVAEIHEDRLGGDFVVSTTPLFDDRGEMVGAVHVARDITERKRAEEALLRSEKLATVGRMAASIAHEINNPLAAVTNTVYLAKMFSDRPDVVREYLDTADDELKRIAHITRQTLGFYREMSAPAVASIGSVLDSAIHLLRGKIRERGARIEKKYDGDLQVMAVSGELRQVFSNLLMNSLEAIGENGTITLRATKSTCIHPGSPQVRVTIADDGQGINSATLPHIFEALFTTKARTGSGLGLWVSKQIIDKHSGAIRVRSCANGARRGTVITVILPMESHVAKADGSADIQAVAGAGEPRH